MSLNNPEEDSKQWIDFVKGIDGCFPGMAGEIFPELLTRESAVRNPA
jgi:hypothetical protein